jgi:hypothetical protein
MGEDRERIQVEPVQIHGPHPDRVIAALAERQHGVVARSQLIARRLTRSMIEERIASGHLVRLHRGVYAVGHTHLRREGHWMAAVLAVGPGAVLSHRDAAALHEVRFSNSPLIDVSTPGQRRVPGVRVHGRRVLAAEDVTVVRGIPVTTVARTLVDLAAILPQDRVTKALAEADRLRKLDVRALHAALERTRGRRGPGHAKLTAALDELAANEPPFTRSELEDRFLALCKAHGLPRPLTNVWLGSLEVDALWPAAGLAVELDGYAGHSGRRAFQRDRDKGNDLVTEGYAVLRFTYADVTRRPAGVAARIARALTRAAGSAAPPRAGARRAS